MKLVTESIDDILKPKDVKELSKSMDPNELLKVSLSRNNLKGVKIALKKLKGSLSNKNLSDISKAFYLNLDEDIIRFFIKLGLNISNFRWPYNIVEKFSNSFIKYLINKGLKINSTKLSEFLDNPDLFKYVYSRLKLKPSKEDLTEILASSITQHKFNKDILNFLVNKGADIHFQHERILRDAVIHGNLELVKFLIEKGAKIDAYGNMAIRNAAQKGNLELVKFLIEKGADPTVPGYNAYELAKVYNHKEVLNYLLKFAPDKKPEDFTMYKLR